MCGFSYGLSNTSHVGNLFQTFFNNVASHRVKRHWTFSCSFSSLWILKAPLCGKSFPHDSQERGFWLHVFSCAFGMPTCDWILTHRTCKGTASHLCGLYNIDLSPQWTNLCMPSCTEWHKLHKSCCVVEVYYGQLLEKTLTGRNTHPVTEVLALLYLNLWHTVTFLTPLTRCQYSFIPISITGPHWDHVSFPVSPAHSSHLSFCMPLTRNKNP